MTFRTVLHLLVLSSALLAAVRGPLQGASSEQPLRYARIAADAAPVFNLADEKGREIARPAKGSLLAVYKETAGWLEVEVPGGFPVWVFGRYLEPAPAAGAYRVTGNAVNLRPAPSSDVTNFPLPQRLQAGDELRGIEVLEPAKPLAETWVRVWSPPGIRGYVRATAVAGLAAGEDGGALWQQALGSLPAAPPAQGTVAPKEPAAAERRAEEGRTELEAARAALERERARETPDFAPIEAALEALAARGGVVALEARAELRSLATLREAAALRADLERERARRSEEALVEQRRVWEESRARDPLGQAFLARGVLERRTGADGVARFYLEFGGETRCELTCPSGRYDLATFAGIEVGVQGRPIASRTGELATHEVSRLEVLTVR